MVSVPRLAAVFAIAEPMFLGLPTAVITGPGYGLATAACALYVWHVYQKRKGVKLAKWLIVGWAILLAIVAVILTPAIMAQLRGVALIDLLPFPLDLLWSALLSISSELVAGLAALATAITKDSGDSLRLDKMKSRKIPRTYVAECDRCDWQRDGYENERAARNAANAHKRIHREHEETT